MFVPQRICPSLNQFGLMLRNFMDYLHESSSEHKQIVF